MREATIDNQLEIAAETETRKKRKAPSGPGQIIRRGNTYLCRVFTGRDATGRKSYVNKTVHSKKDAEKWVRDQLQKQDLGIKLTRQTKTTLGDHIDSWLKDVAKTRVSNVTWQGYEQQLRVVKSTLGNVKLTDLAPKDIQGLYAQLSPSVARHVHAPLRSALNEAIRWHLIHDNPCDSVDRPRHSRKEISFLTVEEVRRLNAVKVFTRTEPDGRTVTVENKYRALFAFLVEVGCRPSEAFALRWSDLDLDRATVQIRRSVEWLNKKQGGSWYFKDTKTKSGRRCLSLSTPLVQRLREHRNAQNEALLKLGIRTDLVFASSEGTPLQRRNLIRRHFKPILRTAGIRESFPLYSLRHTATNLEILAGVNVKAISERRGHSSVAFTLDTYAGMLPSMMEEATKAVERVLYG